jgi:hypothetical protein
MTHDQADTWSGSPPVPPNRGDFYDLLALLPPEQRTLLDDVRSYLESDVAPIIADHWPRAEFPAEHLLAVVALGAGVRPVIVPPPRR